MSLPLKDFRLGITDGVHAALEARAIAAGSDMQTVAREILVEWARREHRAYMVYAKRAQANGAQADWIGGSPDLAEDAGTSRSGGAAGGRR